MTLSVVIVNYNVKHFLEQCLISVNKAAEGIDTEIFVVDNNSVDGSVEMVALKFPQVKLIANAGNLGFSKANNQAIRESSGRFVLLLNPDTVVEHDTFSKCVSFMESHPDCGALGIQMVDGQGKFLPESKRGLPTPRVAFFKIFGLAALFPKSRIFGKYHLGYLRKDETHEVDVLSGAFMMLRREAFDLAGLLDEDFFMYGEDIDLSYRIQKAGFRNYYLHEARIIHYKGESTKKSSINYVFVFYNAMIIFARKHFSRQGAGTFALLIRMAIWFRAALALLSRFLKSVLLPLADASFIYAGALVLTDYWEKNYLSLRGSDYPDIFVYGVIPLYILIWITSIFLAGGYDRPVRITRIIGGIAAGTVFILVAYALLPAHYRFSRALILLTTIWASAVVPFLRIVLRIIDPHSFRFGENTSQRYIIIGTSAEAQRVAKILRNSEPNTGFLGLVSPSPETRGEPHLGSAEKLSEIIEIYGIDEVIFCGADISSQQIITWMTDLQHMNVEFKIVPPESLTIIGSNSIRTLSDMYVLNVNPVNKPANVRNKRMLDLSLSFLLLLGSPLLMWFTKNPAGFLLNLLRILAGSRSFVGYALPTSTPPHFPGLKPGILNPGDALKRSVNDPLTLENLDILYARNYRVKNDLNIISRAFPVLGR